MLLDEIRQANDNNRLAKFPSPIQANVRRELRTLQDTGQIVQVRYAEPGFGYVVCRHPYLNNVISTISARYRLSLNTAYLDMIGTLLAASNDPAQQVPLYLALKRNRNPDNRGTVLRFIRANPLCTRKQVAEQTGLEQYTVDLRVRELIHRGEVERTKVPHVAAEVLRVRDCVIPIGTKPLAEPSPALPSLFPITETDMQKELDFISRMNDAGHAAVYTHDIRAENTTRILNMLIEQGEIIKVRYCATRKEGYGYILADHPTIADIMIDRLNNLIMKHPLETSKYVNMIEHIEEHRS